MSDHRKLILREIGMIVIVVATYLISRILGVLPKGASALALISTIVTAGVAVFVAMLKNYPETPAKKYYDPGYDPAHYDSDNIATYENKDSETTLYTSKGERIGCSIFSAIIFLFLSFGILAIGIESVGSYVVVSIVVLGIMVALTMNSGTRRFADISPSTHKTTGYITYFGILASLFLGGIVPETVPGIVSVIPGFVAIALLGLLALRKY